MVLLDYDSKNENIGQFFKISRVKNEEGIFKIQSRALPGLSISLLEGACTNGADVILMSDVDVDYQKWKISGGSIQNVHCKDLVLDISGTSHEAGASIQIYESNDGNGQKWTVKSNDLVLMKAPSGSDAKANSNQTWAVDFVDAGYDLGLHPGFPGVVEKLDDQECLSSTTDTSLARTVMNICDQSMSLLVGSELSLGTLKAISHSVNTKGPDRMPG